jgi:hypothetical protein
VKKARQLSSKNHTPISENEHFIALIQAASDDKTIRGKIIAISRLDAFNRQSMLNSLLPVLMRKGAPKELISALGFLKDDDIAMKVLETLK